MKASINFREDRQPLVRAKVPISVLGLPFLSGIAASGDDARELRLDLATAFESGPSVRLSYRPNDASNPFSLTLKSGAGPLGSPLRAPFAISAEFNLVGAGARGGSPSFSLLLKPRLGDFAVRKTVRSTSSAPGPVSPPAKVSPADVDHEGLATGVETPVVEFQPGAGIHIVQKLNGFPMHVSTIAAHGISEGGTNGLLSGFEVTARSVLPLRNRAAVNFKWGVKVPAELRNGFDSQGTGFSLGKLPLLVMKKISVEHVADDRKVKEKKADVATSEVMEACGSVRWQLGALQEENSLLRKAVEDLRSEVGGWKFSSPNLGGGDPSKNGGKVTADKKDRNNGRSAEASQKTTSTEDVSEELKKALSAASSAQRY